MFEQSSTIRWSAPPSNQYKVNFDGAISRAKQVYDIGIVIRDHTGCFMAELSKQFHGIVESNVTEAIAAKENLIFANNLLIPSFVLEGDVLSVIQPIKSEDDVFYDIGPIIDNLPIVLSDFNDIDRFQKKRAKLHMN